MDRGGVVELVLDADMDLSNPWVTNGAPHTVYGAVVFPEMLNLSKDNVGWLMGPTFVIFSPTPFPSFRVWQPEPYVDLG
jgi:hypothetical protein